MKAITKNGSEYEVRFCEPTLYDLERAAKHGTETHLTSRRR